MDQLCFLWIGLGQLACTECIHWSLSNTEIVSFCVISPSNLAIPASSTTSFQGVRGETWVTAFFIQLLHRLLEDHLRVVRLLIVRDCVAHVVNCLRNGGCVIPLSLFHPPG